MDKVRENNNTNGALAEFDGKSLIYQAAGMEGGMDALLDFVRQNTSKQITDKEKSLSATDMREQRVIEGLEKKYQFVRVKGLGGKGQIYIGENNTYRIMDELDRDTIIKKAYLSIYRHKPSANNIKRFGESLSAWVDNEVEGINDGIIMITKDLYWSYNDMDFVDSPSKDNPCFRVLFDSRPTDDIRVDRDKVDANIIKGQFKRTLDELKKNDGDIIPDEILNEDNGFSYEDFYLKPFWTWANENLETFNDLLKSVACNFMSIKPKGAFILIGRTRNGKSSFVKMLHTMFGTRNTSEVRLSELTDPHINMTLLNSVLNAPDEEDEGKGQEVLRAQGYFKMLSTHKSLMLPVYYSQEPQPVPTNFMSYHPMNDIPEWKGTGAEACMRRSLILMFENDLSKMDNNGVDFEKETYNALFYSFLLGTVLAIAKYYDGREFTLSDTQKERTKVISEEIDNITVYLERFMSWFPGGYSNNHLVWEDYRMWCSERGLIYSDFKSMSKKLKIMGGKPSSIIGDDDERIPIVRLEKGREVFYPAKKIHQLDGHTIEYIMSTEEGWNVEKPHKARSVIGWLDLEKSKRENQEMFGDE